MVCGEKLMEGLAKLWVGWLVKLPQAVLTCFFGWRVVVTWKSRCRDWKSCLSRWTPKERRKALPERKALPTRIVEFDPHLLLNQHRRSRTKAPHHQYRERVFYIRGETDRSTALSRIVELTEITRKELPMAWPIIWREQ